MEKWKSIPGFPDYQISSNGMVRSFKNGRERILNPWRNKRSGHLQIDFRYPHKRITKYVHRLIAEAFIPNPDNLPVVRHLNDVPYDNRIENLAWGNQKDNVKDSINNGTHHTPKPKTISVIAIKDGNHKKFNSYVEASKELSVYPQNIKKCLEGKRNTTGGYKFVYPKPRHVGKPKGR